MLAFLMQTKQHVMLVTSVSGQPQPLNVLMIPAPYLEAKLHVILMLNVNGIWEHPSVPETHVHSMLMKLPAD
jgi:hypothetical protein